MKNEVICFKHNEVIGLCEEILDIDFSKPFMRQLKSKIKKIIKITEQAKEDGQRMENRLQEYYEGITNIGFERTK